MISPNLNSPTLSDRLIALDCLLSTKALATRDTFSIVESAHSDVRQLFERMNADHLRMQREIFEYAKRQGWYPVVHATEQAYAQLPRFQPAGARQEQSGYGYAVSEYGTQTGFGGYENYPGQFNQPVPQGTYGQPSQSGSYDYAQSTFQTQYGQHGLYSQTQYDQQPQYGQSAEYPQQGQGGYQAQYGRQAQYGPSASFSEYEFEAAEELGEFSNLTEKSKQEDGRAKGKKQAETHRITRRLE